MSYFPPQSPSYLRARDPSIIAWNRFGNLQKVCRNLHLSNTDSEAFSINVTQRDQDKDDIIAVYLRIKGGGAPMDLYEFEDNTLTCAIPLNSQAGKSMRETGAAFYKKYSFSKVYGPHTTQSEIFDYTIKPKILAFLNGFNCTLMAYGASGSGKTYTMMGTPDEPGVIPRSLDYLFRTLKSQVNMEPVGKPTPEGKLSLLSKSEAAFEIQKLNNILNNIRIDHNFAAKYPYYKMMEHRLSANPVGQLGCLVEFVGVWVSFAEIYNEKIYDLLVSIPQKGAQRNILKLGGLHSCTYIKGLTWIYVRSGAEAYQLMQYGLQNLSYASTSINEHSSRSHSIFSVKLVSGQDAKNCHVSVFNFCDLAGSERQKKTNNIGSRLMESMKINSSLSVLGRCITCVRNSQINKNCVKAPFRESKLTHLFQKALQGKEDILMMVTINPSPDMFDDTQIALQFSAIVQDIVVKPEHRKLDKPDQPCTSNTISDKNDYEWEQLLNENRELRNEKALLVLKVSELEMDFQEEIRHVRTNYEIMLRLKDKRITELEKIEELYKSKEREEEEKKIRELLKTAFKLKEDGDNSVISISDNENTTNNSFEYSDNSTNIQSPLFHSPRSANEQSNEYESDEL